jgi:heat shock protein HtpX
MAAVGLTVFVVYAVLAAAGYVVIASFLRGLTRTELLTTALLVVGLTLAFGYLSYRFGTARLLEALDARALPPERSPALYDRLDELADRMGVETPTVAVARMEMRNALAVGGGRDEVIGLEGRLFRLLDGPSKGLAWLRGRPREGTPGVDLLRATIGRAVLSVRLVLTLLVRAHSRRREFEADERAAEGRADRSRSHAPCGPSNGPPVPRAGSSRPCTSTPRSRTR